MLAAGPQESNVDEQEDNLTQTNIFDAGLPLLEERKDNNAAIDVFSFFLQRMIQQPHRPSRGVLSKVWNNKQLIRLAKIPMITEHGRNKRWLVFLGSAYP